MKNVGGQAVIEGVMMRARRGWTVAVRDPKGDIHVKREPLRDLPRILQLPILRGVVALFHSLLIGIKAIEFSASMALDEEKGEKLGPMAMGATILLSMGLGIVLFVLLPLYITKLMGGVVDAVERSSIIFNLIDGIIRVIVFLMYVVAIGLWKEMGRIFQYHGAEHKVIHAYENGKELTIQNIRHHSPLHPRCGTSFLVVVMVTSIFAFSFIPQEWSLSGKFLSRLVLIPLIAGLSYEFLKMSAKMTTNPLMRILIMPGLFLQRLTTREPDEAQIEVAVRALEEVLAMEGRDA
jgi:uncharacterized protein YqhQ